MYHLYYRVIDLDALKELQCFCSYYSALLRQIKICDD